MLRKNGLILALVGSALTIGLAGCGSSDSGNGSGSANALGGDSFLSQVATFIGTSSETSEPAIIDSVTITTPETTESASIS